MAKSIRTVKIGRMIYQTLVRCRAIGNFHTLLVGMQNGTANLENALAVSCKTKHILIMRVWVCAKSLLSCLTLCNPMDCSLPGSSVHGDSSDKHTGVGCHAVLQGIFPTQRSNPISLMSPALAGWFFTTSTTWETQKKKKKKQLHVDIYRSFIHNCQNLEETKKAFTGWIDKLWYIQTMEYYSEPKKKKKRAATP